MSIGCLTSVANRTKQYNWISRSTGTSSITCPLRATPRRGNKRAVVFAMADNNASSSAAAAAASAGGGAVFVYGTLMADEVLRLLLKRAPAGAPATLRGYRRHAVNGQVYPAIVPAGGGDDAVQGRLLVGLTARELEILDAYEAEEYYRARVTAVVDAAAGDGGSDANSSGLEPGAAVEADVYVWKDSERREGRTPARRRVELRRMARAEPRRVGWKQAQLGPHDWDYDGFRAAHLRAYLAMTAEFMAELGMSDIGDSTGSGGNTRSSGGGGGSGGGSSSSEDG